MASVAKSGRPILLTICVTSGNSPSTLSISELSATDSLTETLGALNVCTKMDPSSRRGMNSVPINVSDPSTARMTAPAVSVTTTRWLSAISNTRP